MDEIRIQKIDGQEFVPLKDYKELKEWYENLIRANKKASEHVDELEEENKKLKENRSIEIKTCNRYREKCEELEEENEKLKFDIKAWKKLKTIWEEENQKLNNDLEKFSEAYKKYRDYEKEELAESCYDLARENQKLKEELKERNKLIRDIVLNFHRIDENKILELLLKLPTE